MQNIIAILNGIFVGGSNGGGGGGGIGGAFSNAFSNAFSGGVAPAYDYFLDTYTGAEYAFAFRELRSAYSGPLVQIRRSSDSALKDFYGDSNHELSLSSEDGAGTSLATWIGANDGFVRTWYDQSGNANDSTQTSSALQPQIVTSGVVDITATKAIANFTNDEMYTATTAMPTFSIFCVGSVNSGASQGTMFSGGNDASNRFDFGPRVVSGNRIYVNQSATPQSITGTSIAFDDDVYLMSAFNGGYAVDGASSTSGTITSEILAYTQPFRLGSRYWNAGSVPSQTKIQTLIVYASDQTSNKTAIEDALNTYYTIY